MASYSSTTRTVVPAVPGYCGTTVAELEYSRNSNTMYFFAESFLPKHKCSTTVSVQYEYETDNHVCLLHWHWHQYWHSSQLATGQPTGNWATAYGPTVRKHFTVYTSVLQ